MENTNLLKAVVGELGLQSQEGALRETFFAHQIKSAGIPTCSPAKGDFLVADKYLFEIGGKKKGDRQVKGAEHAYVVRDDMEVGFANTIPLWLFGFLY